MTIATKLLNKCVTMISCKGLNMNPIFDAISMPTPAMDMMNWRRPCGRVHGNGGADWGPYYLDESGVCRESEAHVSSQHCAETE